MTTFAEVCAEVGLTPEQGIRKLHEAAAGYDLAHTPGSLDLDDDSRDSLLENIIEINKLNVRRNHGRR